MNTSGGYRKRVTAIALVGMLGLSMCLTACGDTDDNSSTVSSTNSSTVQAGAEGSTEETMSSGSGASSEVIGESDSSDPESTASDAGSTAEHPAGDRSAQQEEKERETDTAVQADSDKEGTNYADLIDTSEMPHIDPEDYPKVDGSTATLPLSVELYSLTTGATRDEAEHTISHTKTRYAYNGLISSYDGEYQTDLVLAYEPSDEIQQTLDDSGVELEKKAIGRDALVFLVNGGNPVKSLSEQQIVGIYSGEIQNWSEVGGEDKPIDAFQRPQNSGSQTLMEKLVMRGTKLMSAPSYMTPTEMGELIESVSGYDNSQTAIGYSVYFYAHNMYNMPGLRLMEVNGVSPSNETIRDGDYPYVNDFYAVIRKSEPENSPARQLFNWLTDDGGQQLLNAMGYVSVNDVGEAAEDETAENQSRKAGNGETNSNKETGTEDSSGWLIERSGKSFDLGENEAILMNAATLAEVPEIVILDGGLNEQDVIRGVSLESDLFEVADLTEPAILVNTEDGKRGLYDLRRKKWLLDPEYDSISERSEEERTFTAWKYAEWNDETESYDGDDVEVVWKDGKTTEQETGQGAVQVDDYTWSAIDADGNVNITDVSGKKIKSIPFSDEGLSTGYADGSYYMALTENSEPVLFDAKGNIVFTREMIEDRIPDIIGNSEDAGAYRLEYYGNTDGIISGGFSRPDPSYQEYDFLYRLSDDTVLTGEKVKVSSVYADDNYSQKSCYVISRAEDADAEEDSSESSGTTDTDSGSSGNAAGENAVQKNTKAGSQKQTSDESQSKKNPDTKDDGDGTNADRYVLDTRGNRICASDGTPYEHALTGGLFAYMADHDKFVVESRDGKEHYELDAREAEHLADEYEPVGERIAKGIFSLDKRIDDNYQTVLYQGNRRMSGQTFQADKGNNVYAYTLGGGYSLVGINDVQTVYEAESGRKVMTLPSQEYVILTQNGVFVTSGGIFYYFYDNEGNQIGKIASSLEGDD